MSQPKRIVRSRAKGWRMPEGAIYVGRPTQWGNPWRFGLAKDGRWDVDGPGWTGMLPFGSEQDARHAVVRLFRAYLVCREGDELLCEVVACRGSLPVVAYARRITDYASAWRRPGDLVAIEDTVAPSPHMGLTNVSGLMTTERLLGALLWAFPDAVLVPPAGNGSGPLSAYPEALRPTRGKGAGRDLLRHCRSAWDVAGSAPYVARIRDAERKAGAR